jgi:putative ABC transport system substrate-binding protein
MWLTFKRLALGISLIVLTSVVLLLSDLGHRTPARRSIPRIAILQHASSPVLDDGITGMIQGLAEHGFTHGTTAAIDRYNAQADMAVGNAIARQILNGDYDLVLTSSTPSMQAVANANKDGRVLHVFGIVADPFSAGIGLDRADPMKHPKHMVGQSTFLPVEDVFRLMKESLPGLTNVGTAWNPAETNSRAFVMAARDVCRKLGLTLLEANVDNTSGVVEAVQSVIARGAQAFWIPGDNVMMSTIPTIVETIRRARIPGFSISPGKPDRGTFLDVGLDFVEVGRLAGALAASVLRGTEPATIPIRDVLDEVPKRIVINTLVLKGLKEPWRVSQEARQMATILVDETGIHDRSATQPARRPAAALPLSRRWSVDLVRNRESRSAPYDLRLR